MGLQDEQLAALCLNLGFSNLRIPKSGLYCTGFDRVCTWPLYGAFAKNRSSATLRQPLPEILSLVIQTTTYSLHCSSLFGLPYGILTIKMVKPKKGTTMETIGIMIVGNFTYSTLVVGLFKRLSLFAAKLDRWSCEPLQDRFCMSQRFRV